MRTTEEYQRGVTDAEAVVLRILGWLDTPEDSCDLIRSALRETREYGEGLTNVEADLF